MREGQSSLTASFIAVARGLGEQLPEDARLVVDPHGLRFAQGWLRLLARFPRFFARLFFGAVVAVQLRTKLVDDVVAAFVREGGAQLVVLGAGYDCRALRLVPSLAGARVFEVDHPATQARKRALVSSSARYVAFDFEQPVAALFDALRASGFDAAARSLTIWEGVTMYLSAEAVDASLRAIASWSQPGSTLVFSYFTPRALDRGRRGLLARLLRRSDEPLTFAFAPEDVAAYVGARGFTLLADVSLKDLARTMLPARYHALVDDDDLRFAIARRT